jgi:hypothetical protein
VVSQASITLNGEYCEISIVEDTAGGSEPMSATPLSVAIGADDEDAQSAAETALQAAGWTVTGEWEQTDHGYSVKASRSA